MPSEVNDDATHNPSRLRSSPWAARAAACWPTGSSTWARPTATWRRPPRCRAWPSAPARPSTTSSCTPTAQAEADGGRPVLALMPLPGDVDVVLASELDGGRPRGAARPRHARPHHADRLHAPGLLDCREKRLGRRPGRQRPAARARRTRRQALHPLRHGAGRRSLGQRDQRGAVRRARGCRRAALQPRASSRPRSSAAAWASKPSLKAFGAAFARAQGGARRRSRASVPIAAPRRNRAIPAVRALVERVQHDFPAQAQDFLLEGVRRLIDYQDPAYAGLYLDRMAASPRCRATTTIACCSETARHLALWMSYEDTARVAAPEDPRHPLRPRARRGPRTGRARCWPSTNTCTRACRRSARRCLAASAAGSMDSALPRRLVERFTQQRPRDPDQLAARLPACCAPWRHASAGAARRCAMPRRTAASRSGCSASPPPPQRNPELAVELAQCQRLVKGYSDTHERGTAQLRHRDGVPSQRAGAALAPATLRELRDAALADEHGHKLQRRTGAARTGLNEKRTAMTAPSATTSALRVVEARDAESADHAMLRLRADDGARCPASAPAPTSACRSTLPDGTTDWRHYSLINSRRRRARPRNAPTEYVIAVRKEAEGRGGSRFMHERLQRGRHRSRSRRPRTTSRCTPAPAAPCWWPAASA